MTALTIAASALGVSASDCDTRLWYDTPAKEWMEALPLGNGRIGAMVYGGISSDRIALNEITMWSGQRDSLQNDNCGPERLAEIRKAFFDGDIAKGNHLTREYLSGRSASFGTHLPVGDLVIDFSHPSAAIADYRRSLDLSTGVATTTFKRGDVTFKREYIVDYPDNIMAIRLTADRPASISASVSTQLLREAAVSTTDNSLTFDGKVAYHMFGPGGVSFIGSVRLDNEGGTLSHTPGSVSVSDADALTLLIDIRTDYDNPSYKADLGANIAKASAAGFDTLKARHVADHSALFNRMSLTIDGDGTMSHLPTDTRLHLIKNGAVDPSFDALFFSYGRYMQIASSRPASPLCSNLQGIWNDNLACQMAWTCDYHLDININQNYWAANKANLHETNEPLFKYLRHLEKYGSETASKLYGCNGWCAHTVANVWGYTAPGGDVSWGLNVTGGAWLATELWSHFLYTRDLDYLRQTGYPLLKSCAQFFMDYMVEDPATGYLVTGPSISPENGFRYHDGNHYSASMMPTLDRAVVHQIYTACIESSKLLGVDKEMRRHLEKDIKRLPPLAVGQDGMVKEWMLDVTRTDPSHRHSSHLMALYPFGQMSYDLTPELMEAARLSLENQTADPNWENTEWSCGNMIGFYSFLKDPEKAHYYIQDLFHNFTRENLMTVSPEGVAGAPADIFSFDATEASVAGICDMLLQSQNGYVEFLPALPAAWRSGSVKGLCARGAVEADIDWTDGALARASLRATKDTTVKVRIPEGARVNLDGRIIKVKGTPDGLAVFPLKPGQSLNFEI
ncbi:MAG: glycoside hydrolase family 95 protein [Duncaniella sp.]|nr:glycoside hydrolase family 95 protein [Duncaniella sp.]